MSEGGRRAGWTGVGGRGQDGVGRTGMENGSGVGVGDVDVTSMGVGCYEAMASGKFCPELVGCLGEGIILTRE